MAIAGLASFIDSDELAAIALQISNLDAQYAGDTPLVYKDIKVIDAEGNVLGYITFENTSEKYVFAYETGAGEV